MRSKLTLALAPFFILLSQWRPAGAKHIGAKMGVLQEACDDARGHLDVDWPEFSYKSYTCLEEQPFQEDPNTRSTSYTIPGLDPENDLVIHKCMNETLEYPDNPPLRGDHRPNWAVYGEYLYLPPQRWLHNLEHGTVVMLYHPCASRRQVDALRGVVTGCLWRHIVTPYGGLSRERVRGCLVLLVFF